MSAIKEGTLFTMGNPLLDISAETPMDFVNKYEVKMGDAALAEEKHQPIYDEMVEKFNVEYIAGGATQNTARMAQWILGTPKAVSYVGCIGQDKFGKQLQECATKDGVNVAYLEDKETPTGTCAVLVNGKERSLIANLAAANKYDVAHLKQPEVWKLVEAADAYYIAGFFLTVSVDAMLEVAKHAAANNKPFCMNLSAPFLIQFFKEPMLKLLPYVDFLFSNEDEAAVFGKVHELGDDLKVVAEKLGAWEKVNKDRKRTVLFTQGSKQTIVFEGDKVTEVPVAPIDADKIVDTNAAGDSFCGGFLAQLVQGKDIETCVKTGHAAAGYIIQQSGCTLAAGTPPFMA